VNTKYVDELEFSCFVCIHDAVIMSKG